MSILVTGGAGYIGSHTVVELLEKDYDVIVIDNLSNSSEEVVSRIELITNRSVTTYFFDLLEREKLEEVFRKHHIEAVIHFAGFKAVGESVEYPLKYYENNLLSTINLCQAMDKYQVYKMIFSSSATVYGVPEKLPITEDCTLNALNPYGKTKQMTEEMLMDLAYSNANWRIALLRYFNPVGAHPSGLIGENPKGIPDNLMPYITQVASGRLQALNVFGGDYPTKDGTGVRDYIHVVDLALGHIKALERIDQLDNVDVFNLGTGKGYSVLEIIKAFEKISGRKVAYNIVERREGDVATCFANSEKALKKLDWKTKYNLDDMCRDAWHWEKSKSFKKITH